MSEIFKIVVYFIVKSGFRSWTKRDGKGEVKMEYIWKHGIVGPTDWTLEGERPLKPEVLFVDLYNGERYRVLSVSIVDGRDVVQTWPCGQCEQGRLAEFREKYGYVETKESRPRKDLYFNFEPFEDAMADKTVTKTI